MSSNPKRIRSEEPQATFVHAERAGKSARSAAREDEIRLRAHEIYLKRGEQPGSELDDWLQAERELEGEALSRARAG
jgi:hypothetical protein